MMVDQEEESVSFGAGINSSSSMLGPAYGQMNVTSLIGGEGASSECPHPEPVDYVRLITVLIGAPFGILGIFTNGILIFLFMGAKYRSSPTLYLAFLAVLDVLICLMYVLIFPVDALAIFYQIEWLWIAWHKYSMVLYAMGRIVHLASTFMVVCATFERFLITWKIRTISLPTFGCLSRRWRGRSRRSPPAAADNAVTNRNQQGNRNHDTSSTANTNDHRIQQSSQSQQGPSRRRPHHSHNQSGRVGMSIQFFYSSFGRKIVIIAVFVLATLLRLMSYFEYSVTTTDCSEPFTTLAFEANMITNYAYREIFNFYIMNFIQVFLPFFLLLFFNIIILIKMRINLRQEDAKRKGIYQSGGGRAISVLSDNSSSGPLGAGTDDQHDGSSRGGEAGVKQAAPLMFAASETMSRSMAIKATKKRLKAVTYTIVAMVTSYLICGSFDLTIKILENVAKDTLNSSQGKEFHRLSTDIISILFTVNSFLRLPIYLLCNRDVRADFVKMFCAVRKSHKLLPQSTKRLRRAKTNLLSSTNKSSSAAVAATTQSAEKGKSPPKVTTANIKDQRLQNVGSVLLQPTHNHYSSAQTSAPNEPSLLRKKTAPQSLFLTRENHHSEPKLHLNGGRENGKVEDEVRVITNSGNDRNIRRVLLSNGYTHQAQQSQQNIDFVMEGGSTTSTSIPATTSTPNIIGYSHQHHRHFPAPEKAYRKMETLQMLSVSSSTTSPTMDDGKKSSVRWTTSPTLSSYLERSNSVQQLVPHPDHKVVFLYFDHETVL